MQAALLSAVLEAHRADIRFFHRHPARRFRVRPATSRELQLAESRAGAPAPSPAGYTAFVAIQRLAPGRHARVIGFGRIIPEGEIPEDEAREAFERFDTLDNAVLLAIADRHDCERRH